MSATTAVLVIPKDLDEAIDWLKKKLSEEELDAVRSMTEKDFAARNHFGLGRWMRNNFLLWAHIAQDEKEHQYSPLGAYFVKLGINHPDDMTGIIMDSFWRHVQDQPRKLEEQIQFYIDYWKKSDKEHDDVP